MRGHVLKRSKGCWTIVLDLERDPVTAERRQKWLSVKGTKRDAERKLAEVLDQLNNGRFTEPTKITVGAFLQRWV